MRYRFLHAADLHLDTPFTGMQRTDARLATTLRDATTKAFENLADAAIRSEVAFVLLAGDIYDGPERGVRAQLAFRASLDRMAKAGVRTFLVHGNHDPIDSGWSAVRTWPPGVTVFGGKEVGRVPVERDGRTIALVHGVSYATKAVTENLALRFRRDPADCLQVGLLHCNVGVNADHAPYSPCTVEDLEATGIDYWALGHVHTRQVLRAGAPWIAYPGNLQGLSPKPSERGAKGALLVDVEDSRVQAAEFLPLDVVRFDELAVDVSGIGDVATLVDEAAEAARVCGAAHDGRTLVLRVLLSGRGPLHRDLRIAHVHEAVLQPLRSQLATGPGTIWIDSVEDRTKAEIDPASLRGRGDFAADLVANADAAITDASLRRALLEGQLEDLLPRGELRRILGGAFDLPPSEAEVQAALELALDRLSESES